MTETLAPERGISLFSWRHGELAGLHKLCTDWDFWPSTELESALKTDDYSLWYAGESPDWSGVLLMHTGPFSADVIYIYVPPQGRRKGNAFRLLRHLIEVYRGEGTLENIFLEVRVSHEAARTLYEKAGMQRVGHRKKYYSDGEDAFVYCLELSGRENK